MEFEYDFTSTANSVLEVDDIFNVGLKATTYQEKLSYMVIRTNHGKSTILFFGPLPLDEMDFLPDKVNCSFKRIAADRKSLNIEIKKFINQPGIQTVEKLPIYDCLNECFKFDLIEYMKKEER